MIENKTHQQTLWQWLPEFFRHELAPYPGRWSMVARMVMSATLSMIVIVTFRIPYGAIGVNCAFILSRENLTSTAKSGFYFILAFAVWAALIPVGARMFASIPITHFLWEAVTAFLCFFLLKTLTNFPLSTGAVVVATATMAIWYLPGPAELNVELTLWQILATAIGAVITFLVEVVFRSFHPQDPIRAGIDARFGAIEEMLHDYGEGTPVGEHVVTLLTQYAVAGTGMLRQQIARDHSGSLYREKLNAVVSLLGQSIDLSAAIVSSFDPRTLQSQTRATSLAARVGMVRRSIFSGSPLIEHSSESAGDDKASLLSQLEIAIGLMESLLQTGMASDKRLKDLDEPDTEMRLFVRDAFINPEYLRYALAGTAASMLCYVIYTGLDWPGISTAVTTCVLTALSNIGSSRQKQVLRIVGACIGGFVFGVGSQIFVLPYIDSIVGLTILLAFITGISAYVATSSPRLSYVGLQMAFAFYLINVTDFSISLDLTIARDRAVGVLLGIAAMWLVFDRLYSRSAGVEMVSEFARATRLVASLTQPSKHKQSREERQRIHSVRHDLAGLLINVNANADAVPFESGADRMSHLAARERIRRWLSALRTIYVLELPLLQSRLGDVPPMLPAMHSGDGESFCEALSVSLNNIAEYLESQLAGTPRLQSQERSEVFYIASPEGGNESLNVLAKLVNDLEREVLEEPIYAI